MSNIQKESTEENGPEDNSDPVSEEIKAAAPVRSFANPSNPEQMQLAKLQEVERRFQTVFEAAPIGIAVANPQGYFVEVNSTIMEIDGVECNVGLFQNISERLKSEEALRQSEEKYRSILESIEEGYFEVDLSGNFTFINKALCKITGYTPDDLIGTNNRDHTDSETAKKLFHVFNRVYRTGRSVRVLNFETITKDGNKKILDVSASLIRNSDQRPIGFRGLARDVTEHLIAEKEKERMAAQIRQAQKMEAIGTLAGGIAHDFNNLLMGFQGNLSLMLMEITPDNPYYDYLTNMEDYVKRGSDLTRQILGFARGGKYEVRPHK